MSLTTVPPRMHPAMGAVRVIAQGLTTLQEADLWSLSDSEALQLRAEIETLTSRLAGSRLRATREVDVRGAAVGAAATSTTAWLVGAMRMHPGDAHREVRLARALTDHLPATATALADGTITQAAAALIADTDRQLAATATAAERSDAETLLAEHAALLDHRGLQAAAIQLQHLLDPERGERIARDEAQQVAKREFRLLVRPDGSSRPDGYLDKEATAFLRTALDPLAKPRPGAGAERDRRTYGQRMGDALLDLAQLAMRSTEMSRQGGQPVQLVVAIGLEDLEGRLAAAAGELDVGLPLSVEAVRRLACDCHVVPAVLGSRGEPLDVGTSQRTVPRSIRRLVELRDRHCAFPGCGRPPRWCQVHHIRHWSAGGETSCANCVLLCGAHHRTVHHDGWDVVIAPDGLPEFRPPPWIDPQRQPRRNITTVLRALPLTPHGSRVLTPKSSGR
jgi:hypothetical protein